jgi:hypothetical protein
VWDLLEAPRSPAELVDALAPVYEGSPDVIAGDVNSLLRDLEARGFVEEVE